MLFPYALSHESPAYLHGISDVRWLEMNKLSGLRSTGEELWTHPSLSDVSEQSSVSVDGRG